jgi:hypothetical protein
MRFVLFVQGVSERRSRVVERNRPVAGLQRVHDFEERVGESIDGVHHFAASVCGERGKGVECAVHECISIHQQQDALLF